MYYGYQKVFYHKWIDCNINTINDISKIMLIFPKIINNTNQKKTWVIEPEFKNVNVKWPDMKIDLVAVKRRG